MWSDKGFKKAAERHYSTMPLDEVAALPVRRLLKPGTGMLLLWGTWPLITRQGNIMERDWGIPQATGGAWAKRTGSGKLVMGPGYIIRSACEPFLIGTLSSRHGFRGRGQRNLIEAVDEACFDGLHRGHSRKPEEIYRLIEAVIPHARKADVYSRQERSGWDCFGDEVQKFNGK